MWYPVIGVSVKAIVELCATSCGVSGEILPFPPDEGGTVYCGGGGTLKGPKTPPLVRSVSVVVPYVAADVSPTVRVLPLLTVPAQDVYAPPLIEYVPPV